jgi:hypothetical protein
MTVKATAQVDMTDNVKDEKLITRGQAVGKAAVTLPAYATDTVFKGAIDGFVTSCVGLDAAIKGVEAAQAALDTARGVRTTARRVAKQANRAAATQVEKVSTTDEEIVAAGYVALDEQTIGLVLPIAIKLGYDVVHGTLDVHVQYPKGMHPECVIAISPDPITATSYVELLGYGRKRSLTGYAAGTYWVRACTVDARGRSAWFGPFPVVVK